MMVRSSWSGICAVVMAAACGGTVREGGGGAGGTPREQLEAQGPQRCESACATLVACGVDTNSCDCSCSCPANSAGCDCGPCECTQSSPEKCGSDCAESVQEVLKKSPGCEGSMLAFLNCVSGATCQGGELPCKAEQTAVKNCGEDSRGSGDEPPVGGAGSSDPGSSAAPQIVSCSAGSEAIPEDRPGRSGSVACERGWQTCTDGRDYDITCRTTDSGELYCLCVVNGTVESSFMSSSCVHTEADANLWCGWTLG